MKNTVNEFGTLDITYSREKYFGSFLNHMRYSVIFSNTSTKRLQTIIIDMITIDMAVNN